jgi:hypothetical protein
MAQGYRTAVHVSTLNVPFQFTLDDEHLGGKGLVEFDQIQIGKDQACFL